MRASTGNDFIVEQIIQKLSSWAAADCAGGQTSFLSHEQILDWIGDKNIYKIAFGGVCDLYNSALYLYYGNLTKISVPLSWFRNNGKTQPDFTDFEIIDSGHTVRFGGFEASSDSIIEEFGSPNAKERLSSDDAENVMSKGITENEGLEYFEHSDVIDITQEINNHIDLDKDTDYIYAPEQDSTEVFNNLSPENKKLTQTIEQYKPVALSFWGKIKSFLHK